VDDGPDRAGAADARVRMARLTQQGAAERRVLDERSDQLAASILEPLDEAQQERLVAAMTEVEREAIAYGAPAVRLETNRNLTEAIALYRSAGFHEVPAFNAEPYAHHWFEKPLRRA
jgi:hypothetical protein